MRQFLFVHFLLACMPAALVHAEPYATYNPATGDITFVGTTSTNAGFRVTSLSNSWTPRAGFIQPIITPDHALPPKVVRERDYLMLLLEGVRRFEIATFKGAIKPGTPISDLEYRDSRRQFSIFEVPEPPAFAMSGVSLLALAALRRRK